MGSGNDKLWLLENDVGWATMLMADHDKPGRKATDQTMLSGIIRKPCTGIINNAVYGNSLVMLLVQTLMRFILL